MLGKSSGKIEPCWKSPEGGSWWRSILNGASKLTELAGMTVQCVRLDFVLACCFVPAVARPRSDFVATKRSKAEVSHVWRTENGRSWSVHEWHDQILIGSWANIPPSALPWSVCQLPHDSVEIFQLEHYFVLWPAFALEVGTYLSNFFLTSNFICAAGRFGVMAGGG